MGFSLSGYLGIAVGVLLLALAGSGLALKNAYQTIGAFEAAQAKNEAELKEARDKVEEVKALRAEDQRRILALSARERELQDELSRVEVRYEKWRSTLDERTLEKPEVTRRAARRAIRVRQCQLWRDTGGVGPCPK